MKKITLLLCFILVSGGLYAQVETNTSFAHRMATLFSPLDKDEVPYGILLDYGMEFTNVPAFDGTLTDSTYTDLTALKQIYNTLLTSRIKEVSEGFVTPRVFDSTWKNVREKDIITLAGLFFGYARFSDDAIASNKLSYRGGKFYNNSINGVVQDPYEKKRTFAMAPAIKGHKGLHLQVKVPSELFYTNLPGQVRSIQMDFGNGQGYVTVPFDQSVDVAYATAGVKTWTYRLNLSTGTALYNRSRIKIEEDLATRPYGGHHLRDAPERRSSSTLYAHSLRATRHYDGQYASVNLTIDDTDNDGIRKPLIVAEGFDVGVILEPENSNGNSGYKNFIAFLAEGGTKLRDLMGDEGKEYDIIFVDWHNGVDYMQRNAYALQEVIRWVNQQKARNGSTAQNVVLGQSMGGVIARYALADMEENNIDHDTRLFISHDAPQQGANLPIGLQFMYRHLTNQYIQAGTTLFGGDIIVPVLETYGISERLSLLDAPASRQLVKNFATLNYDIDNTVHTSFYDELRRKGLPGSGGYPVHTRNIAISNGSECGSTQGFAPGEHLVNYQWNKGLSFWGDLASLVINPLGGTMAGLLLDSDFFGVAALGLIPGHSKYKVDFQARSIPYGTGSQIYKGRISYTKKILWLVDVTVDITNTQKEQPSAVLPLDTYGGGYYWVGAIGNSTAADRFVRDRFSFIPTTSALDIGKNNIALDDADYLRSYVGATPPTGAKSSPFANFSTEFDKNNPNTHNKRHVSFNLRSGDWLAAELNASNLLLTDCSAFCSGTQIIGSDDLCGSETYTIDTDLAAHWYWSYNGGSFTLPGNGNSVTITRPGSVQGGIITLSAVISKPGCGQRTLTKEIRGSGGPKIATKFEPTRNMVTVRLVGADNTDIRDQGITSTTWEELSSDGGCAARFSGSGFSGRGHGPCTNWRLNIKISATNACGTSTLYETITPPPPGPCRNSYRFSQNPMVSGSDFNKLFIDLPCGGGTRLNRSEHYTIDIHDHYGKKVFSRTQVRAETEVDLSGLQKGLYIVKLQTGREAPISKKLQVE